ncbi:primosomal protein N' [Actinomyces viscosus]|uniref:primosomal protein N' n=1 Tax=Actinomyces viscosus TaxID=1656 RepID=UPI0028EF3B96|nr:primosomal protein N' [Actinomyces viscosus]
MASGYDDAPTLDEPGDLARRKGPSRQGELLDLPEPGERTVTVPGVTDPVARVLLDSPVPHLDRTFDYSIPAAMTQEALPGTRVVVRFGEQEMRGWIWQRATTTTHIGRLSPLRRVVSDLPVLPESTRRLVEAVAARSAGTRSDVVRLALPARHTATETAERDRAARDLPAWERPPTGCGWQHYDGGEELLRRLADGEAPRVAWCALPAQDQPTETASASAGGGNPDTVTMPWQVCLARAVQACLASSRGAVIVVATTAQAEALAARLRQELGEEPVVVLSAEHGPARRYRAFLTLLLGRARVVVGTRAAAFAPVRRLGLAVIWDDGDNRLAEPHAPYVHTRTVLALRSTLEGAGLLIGGFSRSVEAQSLVEQGWCRDLTAPRHVVRSAVPRTEAPGPAELDREGASGAARIPSLAHRALRRALEDGPVLIQVPRAGYAPLVACARCRTAAHCPVCGGPVAMDHQGRTACRWCARTLGQWSCHECGGHALRMVTVGSARTGEELGRAFPGTPVVVSGAREAHGVVDEVDGSPRLVVATPGAEPVAEGGYRAVLLLDGGALSSRPDLGAAGEALRQWTNAVVLAAPSARVILLGGPDPVAAQALVRWDQAGFARRDLMERAELHLPPAWRVARLDGPVRGVETVLAQAEADGFEILGPVAPPPVNGQVAPGMVRALVRAPRSHGKELSEMLAVRLRDRSARREEQVRVEMDPTRLW